MKRIALSDAREPLSDLLEKLSGDEGGMWLRALKRTLNKENPWGSCAFPLWKAVALGTHESGRSLRAAIEESGQHISEWTKEVIDRLVVSPSETDIDLVRVNAIDLGFRKWEVTLGEICERALDLGLGLCPTEIGPQLRLQYADQPRGEHLAVAMEPVEIVADSEKELGIFILACHSDDMSLWLDARFGRPDRLWYSKSHLVFVQKRLKE